MVSAIRNMPFGVALANRCEFRNIFARVLRRTRSFRKNLPHGVLADAWIALIKRSNVYLDRCQSKTRGF